MTEISLDDLAIEAALSSEHLLPIKKNRKSLSQQPSQQQKLAANEPSVTFEVDDTIHMSSKKYEKICSEFRCPICRNILQDPVWLPCMHVFCHKCVRVQVVNEKTSEKLAKCAECKCSFSHRSIRQNKKFENILEIFKSFRDESMLCTQIPQNFPIFDPIAAKAKLLNSRKIDNETTRDTISNEEVKQSKTIQLILQKEKGQPPLVKKQSIFEEIQKTQIKKCDEQIQRSENKNRKDDEQIEKLENKKRKIVKSQLPAENQKKLKYEVTEKKPTIPNGKIEILHSMLGQDQVRILEMHINLYHTKLFLCQKITEKFDQQILVVQNHESPQRSPKTLMALVYNIPIIGFQWVSECQDKQKLLPFSHYQFKRQSTNLSKLFEDYNFYFPQVSIFNNFRINKSKFSFDNLKVLILKCGGQIYNTLNSKTLSKTLVRVKCSSKFNRNNVDYQIAIFKSKNQQAENEYDEVMIDFHWVTDSVYSQEILPLDIYEIQ